MKSFNIGDVVRIGDAEDFIENSDADSDLKSWADNYRDEELVVIRITTEDKELLFEVKCTKDSSVSPAEFYYRELYLVRPYSEWDQ